MDDVEMVSAYEELAQMTQEMLAAVQQRDWNAFSELEARQGDLVLVIQQKDTVEPTDPTVRARKKALLEDLLQTQQRITDLLIPWRSTMAALLNGVSTARRVNSAYSDPDR